MTEVAALEKSPMGAVSQYPKNQHPTHLADFRWAVNILDGKEFGQPVEEKFDERGDELRIGDNHVGWHVVPIGNGREALHWPVANPTLRQRLDRIPTNCFKGGRQNKYSAKERSLIIDYQMIVTNIDKFIKTTSQASEVTIISSDERAKKKSTNSHAGPEIELWNDNSSTSALVTDRRTLTPHLSFSHFLFSSSLPKTWSTSEVVLA